MMDIEYRKIVTSHTHTHTHTYTEGEKKCVASTANRYWTKLLKKFVNTLLVLRQKTCNY